MILVSTDTLYIPLVITAFLTATCDVISNAPSIARKADMPVSLSWQTVCLCQLEKRGLRRSARSVSMLSRVQWHRLRWIESQNPSGTI